MQKNTSDPNQPSGIKKSEDNFYEPVTHYSNATIIWFTGLSASGKSSTAAAVAEKLLAVGCNVIHLDGDEIRHGLCSDLGFSNKDRSENIRRIVEVAKILLHAGQVVLVSTISPFRADRLMARNAVAPHNFIEIYMSAAITTCEQRDPKELYRKARMGALKNFTGIDSAYEAPENAEIVIDSKELSLEEATEKVLDTLRTLKLNLSR